MSVSSNSLVFTLDALLAELPAPHRAFLQNALPILQADLRIVALAAGGSLITRSIDEFSDLDLIIAVEPAAFQQVMTERRQIAAKLGRLLVAFTGEHVNEPRLLVCLYGDPLLHIDLKFVSLPDAAIRVEDPLILWERQGCLSAALNHGTARYPMPDLQWIEDRFWIWVHYCAVKIGRGELFEAVDFLAFLRLQVLGPLALMEQGARPAGMRRIEFYAPQRAAEIEQTVAAYNQNSCLISLQKAVLLYQTLRTSLGTQQLTIHLDAEAETIQYIAEIARKLASRPLTTELFHETNAK